MSDSSVSLFFPTTESISFWALYNMLGWLISSARAHSVVIADVSVPAANMSCKIPRKNFYQIELCGFSEGDASELLETKLLPSRFLIRMIASFISIRSADFLGHLETPGKIS